MSTISPDGAKRLTALAAAVARRLWILVAGAKAAKDGVRPLLQAMGATFTASRHGGGDVGKGEILGATRPQPRLVIPRR